MTSFPSRVSVSIARRLSSWLEPVPGALFSARHWIDKRPSVAYVSDGAGWVLDEVGYHIAEHASRHIRYRIMTSYKGLRNTIVHFAAPPLYLKNGICHEVHPSNIQMLTWTHGLPNSPDPNIQNQIAHLMVSEPYLTRIKVQTTTARDFLIGQGVPPEKLVHIPLGIDTRAFHPPTSAERQAARQQLGIPDNAICIGSFQKDSPGWDNTSTEIKWVKGPDILMDVLERVADKHPIFVLLTTPSRGYVISRLEQAGIPYRHDVLPNASALPAYYHALDLYLIPARDEGGPMAMLEAMSSGVPVVSTRMGIPKDAVQHGENGWLADIDDVDGLTQGVETILGDLALKTLIAESARKMIEAYDWSMISERYIQTLYNIPRSFTHRE